MCVSGIYEKNINNYVNNNMLNVCSRKCRKNLRSRTSPFILVHQFIRCSFTALVLSISIDLITRVLDILKQNRYLILENA